MNSISYIFTYRLCLHSFSSCVTHDSKAAWNLEMKHLNRYDFLIQMGFDGSVTYVDEQCICFSIVFLIRPFLHFKQICFTMIAKKKFQIYLNRSRAATNDITNYNYYWWEKEKRRGGGGGARDIFVTVTHLNTPCSVRDMNYKRLWVLNRNVSPRLLHATCTLFVLKYILGNSRNHRLRDIFRFISYRRW